MNKPLPIRRSQTFIWENKEYFCIFTADDIWWVYLPTIFGRRLASVRKKYSNFSFQSQKQFEFSSFTNFSIRSRTEVFLSFPEFKQLLQKEKLENLLLIFEEKLEISKVKTDLSLSSIPIPTSAYIYLVIFPSLKIGKIGITENWKKRLSDLQREYSSDGDIRFHAETKNARQLEAHIIRWLKTQNALVSIRIKKGSESRETFSLKKISEQKVRDELVKQLSLEKETQIFSLQMMGPGDTFLLDKLKSEPEFALKYALERHRIFLQEAYRALSPEKRDQLASQMLSSLSLDLNDEKL